MLSFRRPRRLGARASFLALAVLAFAAVLACRDTSSSKGQAALGTTPDSFRVVFTTSRGTFVVQANRAWAPNGVDRFYELAHEHFFDENRFYRVLPGFIAQFGASDDPKRNKQWDETPLAADPPREKNARATVSFAATGPGERTHQLFVNLKDNKGLDADAFAPIGRVVEGMSVVDSIYDAYGDDPKYHLIATLGNKYLTRMFPKMDYIRTARIVEPAGAK